MQTLERSDLSIPTESEDGTRRRLVGVAGIVFIIGLLAIPDTTTTDALGGLHLLVLSAALLPFLAGLANEVRAVAPRSAAPSMAIAAGATAIAVKVTTGAADWIAREEATDAGVAAALSRVGEVGFIVFLGPLGVALACVAFGIIRYGALPRWLGWAAVPVSAALAANSLALSAEFGPALLLFVLWTVVCSVTLLVSRSTTT